MFESFPEPVFLAVALFAVLITGISKSGLGGGLGLTCPPFYPHSEVSSVQVLVLS